MEQLSPTNNPSPRPPLLRLPDALLRGSNAVLRHATPNASLPTPPPPYTLTELVNLPGEEFHCYLRAVGARSMRGENIDQDLMLMRKAQEFLRRMDRQFDLWMNAVRNELQTLLDQLECVRENIRQEIRGAVGRNSRGVLETNIAEKRQHEAYLNQAGENPPSRLEFLVYMRYAANVRKSVAAISNLDEEFPIERNCGIRIATRRNTVDLDSFQFVPGSQGSDIQRYIDVSHRRLGELDRRQEENGQRCQELIRLEGLAYRHYDKDKWPLPDAFITEL